MVPSLPVVADLFSVPLEVEVKLSLGSFVPLASFPSETEPSGCALMTVAASVAVLLGQVHAMLKSAPASGAPFASVLLMSRSPPMRKQAGPA